MIYVDDRTSKEKETHGYIVVGTDSFMSGWGEARGGVSYAGWACKSKDLNKVESWVRRRSDMKRVRIVGEGYRPSGQGHCHVYVVNEGHNALS